MPIQQIKSGVIADDAVTAQKLDDSTSQLFGFRNHIINGTMLIDQRGTGANTVGQATTGLYSVDRWGCQDNSTGDFTLAQDTDVPTGKGFVKSLKFTVYSTSSEPTYSSFFQSIEGHYMQSWAWGTADAKTVTLSFWVKCSVTGSYSVCLRSYNGSTLRSYPTLFTVNAADTWEYKTITVPGDTDMVPQINNNLGLTVFFTPGIYSGSALGGTANQWATANYHGTSTGSNLMATQGATMRVTGVQLELGEVATPFEHRPYGLELQLCYRYYWKATYTGTNQPWGVGYYNSTTNVLLVTQFPVEMRTAPSALETTGTPGDYAVRYPGGRDTLTAISFFNSTTKFAGTSGTNGQTRTAGHGTFGVAENSNCFLAWSAEL